MATKQKKSPRKRIETPQVIDVKKEANNEISDQTTYAAHASLKTEANLKNLAKKLIKTFFWFSLGAFLGFFFFVSFLYIFYKQTHTNLVYDGVMVNGIDFGGKTEADVERYFAQKNMRLQKNIFIITGPGMTATISAKQINFGYDAALMGKQAYSIGRSSNTFSNLNLMAQAYMRGIQLPPAYHYEESKLDKLILPFKKQIDVQPVDALFTFQNEKVTAFRLSSDGKAVDMMQLKDDLLARLYQAAISDDPQKVTLKLPVKTIKPTVTTDKANNLGIKELIGEGTSLFQHSIDSRVFNISLAASRLNGVLIPPGQTFSFTKTVGDISSLTGYKQAYVIENGKTVLGDGGGVCQVSTTLFRAALNAGLPIVERHAHAYRVGYYEQDSGPGIDAAIYSPTVDLKFKNDTNSSILIQTSTDLDEERLTFRLYGTKDNREVTINKPVVLSQSPAPSPLFQDDPTSPKGEIKQVDFAADGANVYFTRTVKKDGKIYLSDKFVSNYRPWQAIYLRGTQ